MNDIYSPQSINPAQHIRNAADILFSVGCPISVRVLTANGLKAGYFDNPASLTSDTLLNLDDAQAIWVMLNPAPTDHLQLAKNTICPISKTTKDDEIPYLHWLLVDIDPVRFGPNGKPIPKKDLPCVTSGERQKGVDLGLEMVRDLTTQGWPQPVVISSGNGIQLWFRVALANTGDGRALLARVLQGLSLRYSTAKADVDECTFNPSRLARLPGTINRKGEHTPERPHCWAYLIQKPDTLQIVPIDLLNTVAASLPVAEPETEGRSQLSHNWIGEWIAKHKLPVVTESSWAGRGYRWVLGECPFGGMHKNNTAYIVRLSNGAVGAGCLHADCHGKSWHDLRDLMEPGWKEKKGRVAEKSAARLLVEAAEQNLDLFRGSDGRAYASHEEGERREIYEIESKAFKGWLTRHCRSVLNCIATPEALSTAINSLAATAQGRPSKDIYTRIAKTKTAIYIDMGDDSRSAIEVTASGWRLIAKPPVYFRRSSMMAALPVPVAGGNVGDLKRFLNHGTEQNFILSVSWLLAALRGEKPYPVLVISGPHGSAKSTYAEVLRKLVDPCTQLNLRSMPKDERDLAIAGSNNFTLAFTNVSYLSAGMSDAICRMAKGEGFGTRALHTNADEALFGCANPVCLDGIEDFAERPDLLSRAVLVSLPPIPDEKRQEETPFWAEFELARPGILGALLDAVSAGMHNLPHTKLGKLPRMADFARWISACEPALPWTSGEFMTAYGESHEAAHDIAFNSSVVAQAVHEWFTGLAQREWEGTATDLMNEFRLDKFDNYTKAKAWPKVVNAFAGKLRRDIPACSHADSS